MPAWAQGARLAGWCPEPAPAQLLEVRVDGERLSEYHAGRGQPPGMYFEVNYEAATLRIVDEQGQPVVGGRGELMVKRGQQLKTKRGRQRAKAAKKARQAARRLS